MKDDALSVAALVEGRLGAEPLHEKRRLNAYIVYWNTGRYQVRLKGMTPVQCTASHFLDTRNGRLLYAIRP